MIRQRNRQSGPGEADPAGTGAASSSTDAAQRKGKGKVGPSKEEEKVISPELRQLLSREMIVLDKSKEEGKGKDAEKGPS